MVRILSSDRWSYIKDFNSGLDLGKSMRSELSEGDWLVNQIWMGSHFFHCNWKGPSLHTTAVIQIIIQLGEE